MIFVNYRILIFFSTTLIIIYEMKGGATMEPIHTDPDFLKNMGRRIKERRKQLRMTQDELAELVDATPQMVSSAELGKKALRPENLYKVCRALGVSADYILSGAMAERDIQELQNLLLSLTSEQLLLVKDIILCCIKLCKSSES